MPTVEHSRPISLVEVVCARIGELVAGLAAEPGEEKWLPPLQQLAENLGVSRSVVREAVKRMEMQGVLETRHGVGVRVIYQLHRPVSAAVHLLLPEAEMRLRQLVEVRTMLEPAHARLAAERGTLEDHARLEEVHRQLVHSSTVEEAIRADMAFHQLLARIAGNRISLLMLQSLADLMSASLSRGYAKYSTEAAQAEHGEVLRHIVNRSAEAAAQAMRLHLGTTLRQLELPDAPVGASEIFSHS